MRDRPMNSKSKNIKNSRNRLSTCQGVNAGSETQATIDLSQIRTKKKEKKLNEILLLLTDPPIKPTHLHGRPNLHTPPYQTALTLPLQNL